jgi:uronate dehydrogenase
LKTLLITGAAGNVGGHLRRELRATYRLRVSDIQPIHDLAPNEAYMPGDVARLADMRRITKGVDAIMHLGGFPAEGDWENILHANIIGCYNLFEAARLNGVKRVLFASSNHAVGFYRRNETIDHRVYPKPDSRYGLSKVFGEQIGSLYAEKYGMEVVCLRIGNVNPVPVDKRRLSIWISPRDLAQLVTVGIENPNISFEIVYGVSDNRRSWYDNANARRLGYRPQDDSEPYAADVLAKEKTGEARSEIYQGGTFTSAELGGDPSRTAPLLKKAPPAKNKSATKKSAAKKNPSVPKKPVVKKKAGKSVKTAKHTENMAARRKKKS